MGAKQSQSRLQYARKGMYDNALRRHYEQEKHHPSPRTERVKQTQFGGAAGRSPRREPRAPNKANPRLREDELVSASRGRAVAAGLLNRVQDRPLGSARGDLGEDRCGTKCGSTLRILV